MPPIFLHMAMAGDVLTGVGHPVLQEETGHYYFGATTPDIRVLTRRDRSETHFFDLNKHEHQDSVAAFFETHSHLAAPEALSPATVAFVAGYICHLALDERYIYDVYRPHFSQQSTLGGNHQAMLMDRLLQYELDRRRREDPEHSAAIRAALEGCSLAADVGFLDRETLERWLQVAIDQTRHPPDWRRFRNQGGRHVPGLNLESDEDLNTFLQRVPELLEQTIHHVSTAQVDAYVEQSTEAAANAIRTYLAIP